MLIDPLLTSICFVSAYLELPNLYGCLVNLSCRAGSEDDRPASISRQASSTDGPVSEDAPAYKRLVHNFFYKNGEATEHDQSDTSVPYRL